MEIKVSFKGGRKVAAEAGGYEIVTDQTTREGGEGSAPSPYMLFLSSLATCGSYFVLDFCLARGIDPDSVKMKMDYFWDKEMKEKGEPPKFDFAIEANGAFDEKYLPALERAVSQCAVKKAIEAGPVFTVKAKKV
jgi:putative redox protein